MELQKWLTIDYQKWLGVFEIEIVYLKIKNIIVDILKLLKTTD